MGFSIRIEGYISDNNEIYLKHAKVLQACYDADINELPEETANYFGSKYPNLDLLESKLRTPITVHSYSADMTEGYEIIVSEIPKGVYKIRFTNNW